MMYTLGKKVAMHLFGKSHGPCVGCILEGVPQGIAVPDGYIEMEMSLRKPRAGIGTARTEDDSVRIGSGISDGVTDGTPILITIDNKDTDGSKYIDFMTRPRPGHADLPALMKFRDHDIRGGGQFSGRLTAPIVAAGAIAKLMLRERSVTVAAFSRSIGGVHDTEERDIRSAAGSVGFATRACTRDLDSSMASKISSAALDGDSVGGIVECVAEGLPVGFGGIWFEALDSEIARAVFSIPAVKGIEFGKGFAMTCMRGSESNDPFRMDGGRIVTATNNMGGILGGMSSGMPMVFRAAFKPTPSIAKCQDTVNLETGRDDCVSVGGRHDPCIVPRAVSVVEAVTALVIADQMMR